MSKRGMKRFAGELKREDGAWKERRSRAERDEGKAVAECEKAGLSLGVSVVTSGKTEFPHWVFRDAWSGEQVLQFWPASGKWWRPASGKGGKVRDWAEAVNLAAALADARRRRGN